MGDLKLGELISHRQERGISPARRAEKNRRTGMARAMAEAALVRLHRSDYDELLRQARAKIDAERGPLPE